LFGFPFVLGLTLFWGSLCFATTRAGLAGLHVGHHVAEEVVCLVFVATVFVAIVATVATGFIGKEVNT